MLLAIFFIIGTAIFRGSLNYIIMNAITSIFSNINGLLGFFIQYNHQHNYLLYLHKIISDQKLTHHFYCPAININYLQIYYSFI